MCRMKKRTEKSKIKNKNASKTTENNKKISYIKIKVKFNIANACL